MSINQSGGEVHEGNFQGNWIVNDTPGGANEISGRVIRGSMKEETGQGNLTKHDHGESKGGDNVRIGKMNEVDEIIGGEVQIINCMGCKYRLIDPRSVLLRAGMNNEVVIVSDDPSGIEVRKEVGLNNDIRFEKQTGEAVEKKKVSVETDTSKLVEKDDRPVLDERTLPFQAGKSISNSNLNNQKWEGNWYLVVDESGQAKKRGGQYVYQRR